MYVNLDFPDFQDFRDFRFAFAGCVLLVGTLAASSAAAFSPETHAWVGQQVVADARDGAVTIAGRDYVIDPPLAQALREHPAHYLMGTIGPDAFPDPVVGQSTAHPGVPDGWHTDDFLKHLVHSAKTGEELAFAYGYISHAAGDIFAHTYVNHYAGDTFSITDGEQEIELRHFLVEKFIGQHTPNPPRDPSQFDAPAAFIRDALVFDPGASQQNAAARVGYHLATIQRARQLIVQAERTTRQAHSLIAPFVTTDTLAQPDVTSNFSFRDLFSIFGKKKKRKKEAQPDIATQLKNISETLQTWRENIDLAMEAYIQASHQAGVNFVRREGDTLQLYQDWWQCWGSVFQLKQQTAEQDCASQVDAEALESDVDTLFKGFGKLSWPIALPPGMRRLIQEEIVAAIRQAGLDIVSFISSAELARMIELVEAKSPISAAELSEQFSAEETGKQLLLIPDIAERVTRDMHLRADGSFDPEQFAIAHNAVVLSKLALLEPEQLNRLFTDLAGPRSTVFGQTLYPERTDKRFSLLFEATRSIDGNHQWQHVAPPYPRRGGARDTGWPRERIHGYAGTSKNRQSDKKGFRLWVDPAAREKVFLRIFRGPLTPGLMAHPDLHPSRYSFAACAENPFPRTHHDNGTLRGRDNSCTRQE